MSAETAAMGLREGAKLEFFRAERRLRMAEAEVSEAQIAYRRACAEWNKVQEEPQGAGGEA